MRVLPPYGWNLYGGFSVCKGFGSIGIDDSDMTKPDGHKFEALGIVRDDSESSAKKTSTKKAITLRRLVHLLPATTPSAFFQGSTRQLFILLCTVMVKLRHWPIQDINPTFWDFTLLKEENRLVLSVYRSCHWLFQRGKRAVIVSQLSKEKRMTGNNRNVIIFLWIEIMVPKQKNR